MLPSLCTNMCKILHNICIFTINFFTTEYLSFYYIYYLPVTAKSLRHMVLSIRPILHSPSPILRVYTLSLYSYVHAFERAFSVDRDGRAESARLLLPLLLLLAT